ncbi:MAG: helix-turn-helix transcriptional regulator [Treponema sp.]|nr:helix-turn-helix transcriptional regulator [Treponema sp.]
MFSGLKRFLQTRDELSLGNIRRDLWPLFLIFPMTVILGDFRYFNMNIAAAGLESYELMLYPLGLGWLVLAFIPKKLIMPLLRMATVCCAALLPFQLLITGDIPKLAMFMAFQFFNGICAGCAFFLFCFKLKNIERLFGMAIIIFYYSLYYTIYRAFPAVQAVYKTWGGAAVMAFYLVLVFILYGKLKQTVIEDDALPENNAASETAKQAEPLYPARFRIVIGLHFVYYSIMCMINYIESAENIIFSLPYGLGQLASVITIIVIMMIFNRNSLYIWLMYLVFTLVGMSIVSYESQAAHFFGSFLYGYGDGSGYIIIYYLCAGAIKKSKSIKMYKLFCLIIFIEYFFISGVFSQAFDRYKGSYHVIALSVVLVLCSCCFLILPYLQKRFFEADWTDGLHLKDMVEYSQGLAETDAINVKEQLNMTEREHEIFTMLLKGKAPKEIAYTLKISYDTVLYHKKNLYRKLKIQSMAELFAKYSKVV